MIRARSISSDSLDSTRSREASLSYTLSCSDGSVSHHFEVESSAQQAPPNAALKKGKRLPLGKRTGNRGKREKDTDGTLVCFFAVCVPTSIIQFMGFDSRLVWMLSRKIWIGGRKSTEN